MRSLHVHCTVCLAQYHVEFEAQDFDAIRCRECGGALSELADATTAHEADEIDAPEVRLWLDDDLTDRAAPEGWRHVTTAWEAIRVLDRGGVVELSLDHDPGDDEARRRGIDVVDWLCEQQEARGRWLWPRDGISIHGANPAGREQMGRAIHRYAGKLRRVRETTEGGQWRFRFELR